MDTSFGGPQPHRDMSAKPDIVFQEEKRGISSGFMAAAAVAAHLKRPCSYWLRLPNSCFKQIRQLCCSARDLCCDAAALFVGNRKAHGSHFVLQSIMAHNALPSRTRPGGCGRMMDECFRLTASTLLNFFLFFFFWCKFSVYVYFHMREGGGPPSGRLLQVQRCTISEILAQSRWEGQRERRKD